MSANFDVFELVKILSFFFRVFTIFMRWLTSDRRLDSNLWSSSECEIQCRKMKKKMRFTLQKKKMCQQNVRRKWKSQKWNGSKNQNQSWLQRDNGGCREKKNSEEYKRELLLSTLVCAFEWACRKRILMILNIKQRFYPFRRKFIDFLLSLAIVVTQSCIVGVSSRVNQRRELENQRKARDNEVR